MTHRKSVAPQRHETRARTTHTARPFGPYPLEADKNSVRIPVRDGTAWVWARIDAGFLPRANSHRWRLDTEGYPLTTVYDVDAERATHLYLHRLVTHAPAASLVDHCHGDRLDARRSQLRFATYAQNSQNRRVSRVGRSSRYRGVTLHRGTGKWQAGAKHRETVGGPDKFHHGGLHATQEDAARAYDRLALQLFGEFAVLNFADSEPLRRAA